MVSHVKREWMAYFESGELMLSSMKFVLQLLKTYFGNKYADIKKKKKWIAIPPN